MIPFSVVYAVSQALNPAPSQGCIGLHAVAPNLNPLLCVSSQLIADFNL